MANKGTLHDLKKFRVGYKPNQQFDASIIPANDLNSVDAYHMLNQRNIFNYSNSAFYQQKRLLHQPNFQHNFVIQTPNILQPKLLSQLIEELLPEFITKHTSYLRHPIKRSGTLPLSKARIEVLKKSKDQQHDFSFLWEAFPQFSANHIYLTLDNFDWSLPESVEWLNTHKTFPLKKINEDELKQLLEQSDDEWLEIDDSTDRYARAEFDAEEYNFIFDAVYYPSPASSMSFINQNGSNFIGSSGHLGSSLRQQQHKIQINNSTFGTRGSPTKRKYESNDMEVVERSSQYNDTMERFNNYTALQKQQQLSLQQQQAITGISPINTSYVKPQNLSGTSYVINNTSTGHYHYGSESDNLLDYFNNSTKDELLALKFCTPKKCETILQQRPFRNYEELHAKFERFKYLGVELLQSAKKMLYVRKQILKLLQHCEQLSNELQRAVDNMIRQGHMVVQPSTSVAHSYTLKPYQIAGVNWLNLLYQMNMNAILADEMGLGKTVQVLAFLQYLLETGVKGPFLIVVPSSTLENWTNEISIWCPVSRLTIYYGNQGERRDQRYFLIEENGIEQLDIILTTYAMVSSTTDDKNFFKRILFTYVIFDEAHMLKNMTSLRYKFLMKIKSKYRILMTGTPIQNNLMELMSLMQFILPDKIFEDKSEELKTVFSAYDNSAFTRSTASLVNENANLMAESLDGADYPEDGGNARKRLAAERQRHRSQFERDRIEQAKRIVKPFVLRRTKLQVLEQLPPKRHEITLCEMTYEQNDLYLKALKDYKEEYINSNTNRLPPMSVLMQLRKIANHPLMVRSLYTDDLLQQMSQAMINEPTHKNASPNLIFDDMKVLSDFELYKLTKAFQGISGFKLPESTIKRSGKFKILDKILPEIFEKGEKILIFSQFTMMLDILGEYCTLSNYVYKRIDGMTPVSERLSLINAFNADPQCPVFLLSTKAGGLGINLTSANHVLIHDIDINPYNDKQAEDRCHRVGQEKVVDVNRLISKDTVEEVILQCNQSKLKLELSMHGKAGVEVKNGLVLGATDIFEGDAAKPEEETNEDIANLLKLAITL